MKLLRHLFNIVIVIATLAIGVLFALQNKTPVSLDLLVYTFDPTGGLIGMLISSAIVLRLRTSLSSANRQLSKAKSELDSLRTAGLKDSE